MPPIPIFSDAPINPNAPSADPDTTASKASGITPQTATPPTRTAAPPATTTSSNAQHQSSPPAPQPGARPQIPTPTTAFTSLPNEASTLPAAPQPGAVPSAQPTRVIEQVFTTTETRMLPPQASLPPPTDNQLAGKSTSTYQPPQQGPGPTTLSMGAAGSDTWQSPIERPPGYTQNQRAFQDPPALREAAVREDQGGLMQTLTGAGESLKKGEEAIWKWVEGKTGK